MKKLCKIKKVEFDSLHKKIYKEIKKPKFYCKKCLRVAKHAKYLCSAQNFK
ncbi:hypothetical protein [Malaciobacter halophilus]|uniref:hypothetical protein n=1 Tax=Malaciobacter halophilus TaxID=197482 RepID=UPI0013C4D6D2|nr:hypothetical protein [Malaciobacter halophilus]